MLKGMHMVHMDALAISFNYLPNPLGLCLCSGCKMLLQYIFISFVSTVH